MFSFSEGSKTQQKQRTDHYPLLTPGYLKSRPAQHCLQKMQSMIQHSQHPSQVHLCRSHVEIPPASWEQHPKDRLPPEPCITVHSHICSMCGHTREQVHRNEQLC